MVNRRQFIQGAAALFCAPAIVKAENIMQIWVPPNAGEVISLGNTFLTPEQITREALRVLHNKVNFIAEDNLIFGSLNA